MNITEQMKEKGFTEIKDKIYPDLLFFTKGDKNSENMLAIICVDPNSNPDVNNIEQTYNNYVERESW